MKVLAGALPFPGVGLSGRRSRLSLSANQQRALIRPGHRARGQVLVLENKTYFCALAQQILCSWRHRSARNIFAIKHLCTQALAAFKSFMPQPQSHPSTLFLIVQAARPPALLPQGTEGATATYLKLQSPAVPARQLTGWPGRGLLAFSASHLGFVLFLSGLARPEDDACDKAWATWPTQSVALSPWGPTDAALPSSLLFLILTYPLTLCSSSVPLT